MEQWVLKLALPMEKKRKKKRPLIHSLLKSDLLTHSLTFSLPWLTSSPLYSIQSSIGSQAQQPNWYTRWSQFTSQVKLKTPFDFSYISYLSYSIIKSVVNNSLGNGGNLGLALDGSEPKRHPH